MEVNNTIEQTRPIRTALISVFHKGDGLEEIVRRLDAQGVRLLSTGGTKEFIEGLGVECEAVETLTGFPSILGGRVKTLHPAVFGGILARRSNPQDTAQRQQYGIPEIDLVVVDLYPFAQTAARPEASEQDIIEKIDIGGISLIRAAAKNFEDVAIVASRRQYGELLHILELHGAATTRKERLWLAKEAFGVSSAYDAAIFNWFDGQGERPSALRLAVDGEMPLRYGENPHQGGEFFGEFDRMFDKLHGKEISYNNLGDIDAAVRLIGEFSQTGQTTFAVLKHQNPCGVATRPTAAEAWKAALECDPVSAFGGVLVTNATIECETAREIDKIFFEVVIAPDYTEEALGVLFKKKNRIVLRQKEPLTSTEELRSALNGVLVQQRDTHAERAQDLKVVTKAAPTEGQVADLLFANKIVKHCKSNAITLAKGLQMCASGVGQTSRVDALKQAVEKAKSFGFDLEGAVMASDAFFPFGDCVEMAQRAGIRAVVQPGGSIRDNESIEYCDKKGIPMVMTGFRHFKH